MTQQLWRKIFWYRKRNWYFSLELVNGTLLKHFNGHNAIGKQYLLPLIQIEPLILPDWLLPPSTTRRSGSSNSYINTRSPLWSRLLEMLKIEFLSSNVITYYQREYMLNGVYLQTGLVCKNFPAAQFIQWWTRKQACKIWWLGRNLVKYAKLRV